MLYGLVPFILAKREASFIDVSGPNPPVETKMRGTKEELFIRSLLEMSIGGTGLRMPV